MSITSFVSKIFGNKAQRDMSEVQPIVEKIKAKYDEFGSLTADDLRTKIHEIRQMLQDDVAQDKEEIKKLRATIEETEIDKREKIYSQIDALEKKILDKYEHKLDEVLPEVFAVMKHTARFFKENETIEVKATDFDRSLSIDHDFVEIDGDKAIYKNRWLAGGNELVWDMVHYDVQLFGGVVLH